MTDNHEEDVSLPAWLDAALLAECLEVNPEQVLNVTIKSAVPAGSNYCSELWRVHAVVDGEKKQLIVKSPPKGEFWLQVITQMGFFNRELGMYTRTVPAMRELGARRCGPDSVLGRPFTATALPCTRPDTLVLEDLTTKGFRMQERREQLDLPHCKVALEALARFHALSCGLYDEDPKSMDEYPDTIFTKDPKQKEFIGGPFKTLADEMDTWEEIRGSGYPERLRACADEAYLKVADCTAVRKDGRLNVLNHADFWINNFMFRYEEESDAPVDIRLVDLQLCRYALPTLDLHYFLVSSPKEEVRLKQSDKLLEHYRQSFNGHLASLGLGHLAYSKDDLRRDFAEVGFFGLYASVCVLCVVVAEPEDRLRLDELTDPASGPATSTMLNAIRGKTFRRILPGILENFVKTGVL